VKQTLQKIKSKKSYKKTIDKVIASVSFIISILVGVITLVLNRSLPGEFVFLSYLILGVIFFIVMVVIYFYRVSIKKSETHYDTIRESLEKQIIQLQDKLSNTEEQWKSSYHLILSSQSKVKDGNDPAIHNLLFLKNFGLSEEDFIIDKSLVFYLTSFSTEYKKTYEVCKSVCNEMSLNLLRGDETQSIGDIFSQILRLIVKSSFIIVNIDGKNPNVFYELGIAHTLGKNIMFISKRGNEMPFDVRQYRTLFYNKEEELKDTLSDSITNFNKQKEMFFSTKNSVRSDIAPSSSDKSLKLYQKVLDIDPSNIQALLGIGGIYGKLSNSSLALEYYKKALSLDSNNVAALIALGDTYTVDKNYSKAISYFQKVIAMDPNNVAALLALAKLQQKIDD